MQRLWDEERAAGSSELRLETFERLGGAQRIVEEHLESAMDELSPAQKDVASKLFNHLVTPSGTKIAHEVSDLADFGDVSVEDVQARPGRARRATDPPLARGGAAVSATRSSTTCSPSPCSSGAPAIAPSARSSVRSRSAAVGGSRLQRLFALGVGALARRRRSRGVRTRPAEQRQRAGARRAGTRARRLGRRSPRRRIPS